MYIDESFRKVLDKHDIDSMRSSKDTIYIIDSDFKLRVYNRAWLDFAKDNDGKDLLTVYPLGNSILKAIPDTLVPFYKSAYSKALKDNTIFEHDYECSSAELYRCFHQTAYPMKNGVGLIVTNHKVEEVQISEAIKEFNVKLIDKDGMIVQCSHCRKIREPADPLTWLWVPALVRRPLKNTSHTLCPRCLDFYYPDDE